jgi:hypothetical protein
MSNEVKQFDPIETLVQNPEWVAVENKLAEQIASLKNVDNINLELSPEELKIELKARFLAADMMQEFYDENRFTRKRLTENKTPFR